MNKDLIEYIKSSLLTGKTTPNITAGLMEKGWSEKDITTNLAIIKNIKVPTIPSPSKSGLDIDIDIHLDKLSPSTILLFLGAVIIILAGIIYITINWQTWGSLARIGAIFFPMAILDTTAFVLWNNITYKKQALAFIVSGSLLLPLFLIITFAEIPFFKSLDNLQTGFLISGFTFAFYLINSSYFISPVWTLLSSMAGLSSYFFLLEVINLGKRFDWPAETWAFLIPASVLLSLSYFYSKWDFKNRSRITSVLGSLITAFALFYLIVHGINYETTSWLVFIPIFACFAAAFQLEKQKQTESCLLLYFIACVGFFFNLSIIAGMGRLVKVFIPFAKNDPVAIGTSMVIAGIIFLGLAYLLTGFKKYGFLEAGKFSPFFELVGIFGILTGIFRLSLGGKKLFYEILLLISSLGFVFGSIVRQSRIFLYLGTLFIIIDIFDLGSEYFQNEVGWPITLFIAGLISMGIGLGMEKIKRLYFGRKLISG